MTHVGWYVHHHGSGHLMRFLAVRPHLDADVTVFSSLASPASLPVRTRWVELERDDDTFTGPSGEIRRPDAADPTAGGLLHWAPVGHPGHRSRLGAIASAAVIDRLDAFVVDVSAEVALFVRLLGLPLILFTQPGDRGDGAHTSAFDAAHAVIAPWPEDAHASPALRRLGSRVHYVGGISRFEGRAVHATAEPRTVAVLAGGVNDPDGFASHADAAAAAAPRWRWEVIGGSGDRWRDDPFETIVAADVVVSAAGQNAIADLAVARARAIVIPQSRPFDEQRWTAQALARGGLAVVAEEWPVAERWGDLLEQARSIHPDWSRWSVSGAAQRASAVIEHTVGTFR